MSDSHPLKPEIEELLSISKKGFIFSDGTNPERKSLLGHLLEKDLVSESRVAEDHSLVKIYGFNNLENVLEYKLTSRGENCVAVLESVESDEVSCLNSYRQFLFKEHISP